MFYFSSNNSIYDSLKLKTSSFYLLYSSRAYNFIILYQEFRILYREWKCLKVCKLLWIGGFLQYHFCNNSCVELGLDKVLALLLILVKQESIPIEHCDFD